MRTKATAIALALALGACGSETGIIVEVNWNPDPAVTPSHDKLRIYVGHKGEVYATLDESSVAVESAGLTPPYRYVVRPDGDVASIGPLVFAAGLTVGAAPPESVAFAVHPSAVSFADGELRTVRLELDAERGFTPAGDGACAIYEDPQGTVQGIGRPDDGDCDGVRDGADCGALTPLQTPEDRDGDGHFCDDCLDAARPVPVRIGDSTVMIDPKSVFPTQNEETFRLQNGIPDNIECLHIDFDCSGTCGDEPERAGDAGSNPDRDGSGAGECGRVVPDPAGITCAPAPSDCVEDAGSPTNESSIGTPEFCDGADSNCDGRLASSVPCAAGPIGIDRCLVGTWTCDDNVGRYHQVCADDGFGSPVDVVTCNILNRMESCRFDEDPLDCAAEVNPIECLVAPSAACGQDESLRLPGDATGGNTCLWQVVGGTARGDWEVGFVDPSTGALVARTQQCGASLVVRPGTPEPRPYTFLLLGKTALSTVPVTRLIKLIEDGQPCDGQITCNIAILN